MTEPPCNTEKMEEEEKGEGNGENDSHNLCVGWKEERGREL